MGTIDGSVLEGLYLRVLKPEGEFKAQLRAAGFDADRPEARYPEEVFARTLKIAAAQSFGREDPLMAYRRLGHALIEGYFVTILGRVTAAMLPVLGVAGALKRIGRLWTVPQPGMVISAKPEEAGRWTITFSNESMTADLVAGIVEAALRRIDATVNAEVLERSHCAGVVLVKLELRSS